MSAPVPQGHERWHEEIAAFLLGSLDDAETAELERHLAGCEHCSERLRWLRPAAELLPESVERIEPDAELRTRVLEQVRSEAGPAAEQATKRRGRLAGFLRPAIALAGVAVIAAGVAGYEIGIRGDDPTSVPGPPGPSGVTANLERKGDSGTLQVAGLSPLGSGEVYQAWVQHNGVMQPSSLFAPRANGSASAAIPARLDGAEAVLVTIEPRGGSQDPTSAPLVSVPLD